MILPSSSVCVDETRNKVIGYTMRELSREFQTANENGWACRVIGQITALHFMIAATHCPRDQIEDC